MIDFEVRIFTRLRVLQLKALAPQNKPNFILHI